MKKRDVSRHLLSSNVVKANAERFASRPATASRRRSEAEKAVVTNAPRGITPRSRSGSSRSSVMSRQPRSHSWSHRPVKRAEPRGQRPTSAGHSERGSACSSGGDVHARVLAALVGRPSGGRSGGSSSPRRAARGRLAWRRWKRCESFAMSNIRMNETPHGFPSGSPRAPARARDGRSPFVSSASRRHRKVGRYACSG